MRTVTAGLVHKPRDKRNLKLGALITLPKLEELPDEFILETNEVKDQQDSDFCAAFASCLLSGLQEEVPLEPSYTFAVAKSYEPDLNSYGTSLYDILKAHTKVGAIEIKDSPFSLKDKDQQFLKDITNWPILRDKANVQKKQTYLEITGQYDHFDNIRASIWKFKDKRQGVLFGVDWAWPLSQVVMDNVLYNGSGHALSIIGHKKINGKDYLIIQNSYGKEAGENGKHYFSREVINTFVEKYGAFMMVDIPRDKVEYRIKNGCKLEDSWIVCFWKTFINFFKTI